MRASRGRTASRPYASARRSARNRDDGSTALPTPLPGAIGNCRRGVQGCRRSAGMLRAVPSEHRSELSVGSALLCVARCSDFMRRLPFVRPPPVGCSRREGAPVVSILGCRLRKAATCKHRRRPSVLRCPGDRSASISSATGARWGCASGDVRQTGGLRRCLLGNATIRPPSLRPRCRAGRCP